MKKMLLGLALLAAVTTTASAHDKKAKKAKAKAKTEQCDPAKCDKDAKVPGCCMKKTQA
jgi:hypothetical protein